MPKHPPLPEWVEEIRPHQEAAREEIGELYGEGKRVVLVDAPVGSGKTLLGDLVSRDLGVPTTYIAPDKQLQAQMKRDFPYVQLLMGKSNYIPDIVAQGGGFADATCGDCEGREACKLCYEFDACPYQVAKRAAQQAAFSLINTTYALYGWNYDRRGWPGRRPFVIADECDTLEGELLDFVSFDPPRWMMKRMELEAPKKGSHLIPTIVKWIREELMPGLDALAGSLPHDTLDDKRRVKHVMEVFDAAALCAMEVEKDSSLWVRDNDAGDLVMKPIHIGQFARQYLWPHGRRWMLMSGTIISPEQMMEDLGYEDDDWGVVNVPMTFPAKNRPIRLAPVARVTRENMSEAVPKLIDAIVRIMEMHPHDRILVHCVSKQLADDLKRGVGAKTMRVLIGYGAAWDKKSMNRDQALAKYRQTPGAVLFAQSMDRGVDMKDDDCRVQIIAKVPFPNLGDAQVSRRTYGSRSGQTWFNVQTVRTIVQMTGRGVRHINDHAVTYILDEMFTAKLYAANSRLFPRYWRDAIDRTFRPSALRSEA